MAERKRSNPGVYPTICGTSQVCALAGAVGAGALLFASVHLWFDSAFPTLHRLLDLALILAAAVFTYLALRGRVARRASAGEDPMAEKERLQHLIEASIDGIWDWDLAAQTLYLSPRWKAQIGYQDHELASSYETWHDLLHRDDRCRVLSQMRAYLAAPTDLWECEFRLLHRHGGHRWILSRGSPIRHENGEVARLVGVHIDITERKHTERRLREAAAVFEGTNEGIVVTDDAGKVLLVNSAFSRITGYAAYEVIGLRPSMLKSGRHDRTFYGTMWASLRERGSWKGEIWNRRKSGEIYPEWLSISRLSDDDDSVRYVGLFTDIGPLRHTQQRLEYLAHHDALTELPNRLLFHARLEYALARERNQEALALLFIDLDRFKQINDQHGHRTGDRVLRTVAGRLRETVRREDTVARLGGDEFVVLVEAPVERDEVDALVARLLRAIEAPIVIAERCLVVSASIGVTHYAGPAKAAGELLDAADRAMYRVKADRRGARGRAPLGAGECAERTAGPADEDLHTFLP